MYELRANEGDSKVTVTVKDFQKKVKETLISENGEIQKFLEKTDCERMQSDNHPFYAIPYSGIKNIGELLSYILVLIYFNHFKGNAVNISFRSEKMEDVYLKDKSTPFEDFKNHTKMIGIIFNQKFPNSKNIEVILERELGSSKIFLFKFKFE